jgi:phage baseplate assembly protein W
MSEEFVGRGIAFPLRIDATGGLAVVEREREVQEAIRLILATAQGERPMRPEFGCRIHDYIFASPDLATRGRIAYEVSESLRRWEPRINVHDVAVNPDPDERTTLYIDIAYSIRGTNDPRTLVFPFYTIPEERPANGLAPSALARLDLPAPAADARTRSWT